jgi:hypothetical protein
MFEQLNSFTQLTNVSLYSLRVIDEANNAIYYIFATLSPSM